MAKELRTTDAEKKSFFIYIIQIYKLQGLTIQQYKNEKL